MATTAYDIIKRPIITEQSMEQTEMKLSLIHIWWDHSGKSPHRGVDGGGGSA